MKARLTVSCISADTLNMYNQILSSSQCSRSTTGGKSIQRQYLNRSLFQSLECFFSLFFSPQINLALSQRENSFPSINNTREHLETRREGNHPACIYFLPGNLSDDNLFWEQVQPTASRSPLAPRSGTQVTLTSQIQSLWKKRVQKKKL